ncbi:MULTISPECIES: ring-cleaving dioxygenase [Meridianimarinicoccus]|uniref:ring-cleaving dioxygenase n=1 Tax=Meridianimarinicoccus zhengii TaxID=2056810 RepID=UPI0037449405
MGDAITGRIKGIHHITMMAGDASDNNGFYTRTLGLRRIKKTVNFDAPEVYHLYFGDGTGTPGSVMTSFPFGGMPRGRRGTGEVTITEFAVPPGALDYWSERFAARGVAGLTEGMAFGAARLDFEGPDGEGLALVEADARGRVPWTGGDVPADKGILGFNGARMRLRDGAGAADLLGFMGYELAGQDGALTRYRVPGGNAADVIDIEVRPQDAPARQGAGSIHHIAFAVEDAEAHVAVRTALVDAGYEVTPVIDRDYFRAIYFRAPGGVLFEVATHDPGFARDEDPAELGTALKLPARYEPHRDRIEAGLDPIAD